MHEGSWETMREVFEGHQAKFSAFLASKVISNFLQLDKRTVKAQRSSFIMHNAILFSKQENMHKRLLIGKIDFGICFYSKVTCYHSFIFHLETSNLLLVRDIFSGMF